MIRVERSTVPPPEILATQGAREVEAAIQHYAEDPKRRFRFEICRRPAVFKTLRKLFARKCAYCESRMQTGAEVDHFRPMHRAIDLDGSSAPGYYWLANTWENLYYSCPVCNRNKGNRFPILGERAQSQDGIDGEKAILLDPCTDDPAPYLVFLEDGRLAAAPPDSERIPAELRERFGDVDRGQITIDVFGLNRTDLVTARAGVFADLKGRLDTLFWRPEEGYPPLEAEIRELVDDALPYAGLRRQVVAAWLDEFAQEWEIDLFAALDAPPAAPPPDDGVDEAAPPPPVDSRPSRPPGGLSAPPDVLGPPTRGGFSIDDEPAEDLPEVADLDDDTLDEIRRMAPPPGEDQQFKISQEQTERILKLAEERFSFDRSHVSDEAERWMHDQMARLSRHWLLQKLTRAEPGFASKLRKARLTDEVREDASSRLHRHEIRQRSYSVDAPDEDKPLGGLMRTASIARIDIENLRPIEKLETSIGPGQGENVGWKVLLGENGVGKSTVLQAVALALMGEKHLETLDREGHLEPESLLRRGADRGHIHLYLTTSNEPLRIELTPQGVRFEGAEIGIQAGLQTILLGFGSARWLPRKGSLAPDDGAYLRVRNLFNPFVPLGDALGWLRGLSAEGFAKVEDTLIRLLALGDGVRLVKDGGRIRVRKGDQPLDQAIPLDALSDGYQTVLAMACEIMELMGQRWGDDMASAEGVVLIDEIGAHLHPRWKLRVVKSLREAFPRIQFLVTTHEPLCLRGLYDKELMVMRRSEGRLMTLDDLKSPDELRVDQLLTSPLFGLQSTLDPELEQQFEEYYTLLARKGSLKPEETKRLDELRRQVGHQGVLGDSPREQMVYELVDDMLARSRGASGAKKKELKAATKRQVAALWKQLETPGGEAAS